jgi:hypothetical protein
LYIRYKTELPDPARRKYSDPRFEVSQTPSPYPEGENEVKELSVCYVA